MATKCKYYHYHYRGWGMRSLCFFYKILWLIGPYHWTLQILQDVPWLQLLIAITQETLSARKWMEIWFYSEFVFCLQKISRSLIRTGEQNQLLNYRIPNLAPDSHLSLYFVWFLTWILPILTNTFILPSVSQLHFFNGFYLLIYFLNM